MLLQPGKAFDYTPTEVVTREYHQHWLDIMEKARGGAIMDLGSGNNPGLIDNLIKFDMFAFPNVEVVGDAQALPFKEQSFRLILSSAVFEHVRNPFLVADNLREVLADLGELYVESAFLQPLHAYPDHFFNMTKPGIEELFSNFKKLDSGTLPHMYPNFTLNWIIKAWLQKQTPEQREEFFSATIGEIQSEYAKNLFSQRWMENFSKEDREELAAGVFFLGRKYPSDFKGHPNSFEKKAKQKNGGSSSPLSEDAALSLELDRSEKVMCMIDQNGLGIEIGPSYQPLAPKREGFNVQIVDLCSAEELRAKFKGHEVNLDAIEEVDFVWHGEPLPVLIGQEECYDWIIASHIIEHVPDLISFLTDCEKLLKPSGVLSLIIPDKRYCFDYYHSTSSTGEILDAFEQKRTRPSPGKVFDHCARTATLKGQMVWDRDSDMSPKLDFVHDISDAESSWRQARTTKKYFDVHNWRFTPSSFRLLFGDLQFLGLISLGIEKEFGTAGCEFYVTLRKNGTRVPSENSSRMELLRKIKEDDDSSRSSPPKPSGNLPRIID